MTTTEKPKKLVIKIFNKTERKRGGVSASRFLGFLRRKKSKKKKGSRWDKSPRVPVVAKRLRYSLWALL